ncbi:MAG TPA: VOC family protein [Terriglobales bacterium]|nr:VOC family protein [Terriglobales bacterium]
MRTLINSLLGGYESGAVSRREFVENLTLLVGAVAAMGAPAAATEAADRLNPVSINHVAITVSDLQKAKQWYTGLFKLDLVQETPHLVLLRFKDTLLVLRPGEHPGAITHVMFGLPHYDEAALKAKLVAYGLDPRKDLDSFHVKDADGLDVQIGDARMGMKGFANEH